jgi:hypothetical protein
VSINIYNNLCDFAPTREKNILVWTNKGTYKVGAMREQYPLVTAFLKENTKFDLSNKLVHKYNYLFFRKDILKGIFKKDKEV